MSWVLSQNGPTWSQRHPPLLPHPLVFSFSCLNASGVGGSLSQFLPLFPSESSTNRGVRGLCIDWMKWKLGHQCVGALVLGSLQSHNLSEPTLP